MKTKRILYSLSLLINLLLFCHCADKKFIEIPDKTDTTTGGTISGIVPNTTNITPYGIAQRTDGKYFIVYGDVNNGLKSVNMNGNQIVNSSLVSYNVGQVVINSAKLTSDNNILLIGNNKTNDSVFVALIKTETQVLEWYYKIASPTTSPVIGQDIIQKASNVFYAVTSNAPNKPFLIKIEQDRQAIKSNIIDSIFFNKTFIPTSIDFWSPDKEDMIVAGRCENITSLYYIMVFRIADAGNLVYRDSNSIVTNQMIDNQFKLKITSLYGNQFIYVSSIGAGQLGRVDAIVVDNPYSDAAINPDSTAYIAGNNAQNTGNQLVIRKVDLGMQEKQPVKRISNTSLALKAHKIIRTTDGGYLLLATATQTGGNTSLYIVKADKDGTIQ